MMFEISRRNNPFREMEDLERYFFGDPFGKYYEKDALAEFKTDITDEGDYYMMESDLPGFDKKDIHLNLNGDTLTIQAERHSKAEDKDQQGKLVRMERSYGSYSRSFNVSEISTDLIKASYENGVLKLMLPKKQAQLPKSRTLEID